MKHVSVACMSLVLVPALTETVHETYIVFGLDVSFH
jgi:hypothetical protein